MRIDISYFTAQDVYPELVDEIIAKLRRGKSIHKYDSPSDLRWSIQWCVAVESVSFENLFDSSRKRKKRVSEEQYVANYKKSSSAWLCGDIGRWYGQSSVIDGFPVEIENLVRKQFAEERAEKMHEHRKDKEFKNGCCLCCGLQLEDDAGNAINDCDCLGIYCSWCLNCTVHYTICKCQG